MDEGERIRKLVAMAKADGRRTALALSIFDLREFGERPDAWLDVAIETASFEYCFEFPGWKAETYVDYFVAEAQAATAEKLEVEFGDANTMFASLPGGGVR